MCRERAVAVGRARRQQVGWQGSRGMGRKGRAAGNRLKVGHAMVVGRQGAYRGSGRQNGKSWHGRQVLQAEEVWEVQGSHASPSHSMVPSSHCPPKTKNHPGEKSHCLFNIVFEMEEGEERSSPSSSLPVVFSISRHALFMPAGEHAARQACMYKAGIMAGDRWCASEASKQQAQACLLLFKASQLPVSFYSFS